jgi:hypothetical protein
VCAASWSSGSYRTAADGKSRSRAEEEKGNPLATAPLPAQCDLTRRAGNRALIRGQLGEGSGLVGVGQRELLARFTPGHREQGPVSSTEIWGRNRTPP